MKAYIFTILLRFATSSVAQNCEEVSVEGYLIDNFCWDMPDHIAIDGSDLANDPQSHTRHCLFDIPQCVENGYGIIAKQDDGTYDYQHRFNEEDNAKIVEYLADSSKIDDFLVTVEGIYCAEEDNFKLKTLSDGNGLGIEVQVPESSENATTSDNVSAPDPSS